MNKLSGWLGGLIVSAGAIASLGLYAIPAHAADHSNLEEGLPTEVEDAYPIEYRGREVQGQFRYERTNDGKDRFVLDPRLEFGIARNTQVSISAPFYLGNGDKTGSGNVRLTGLYNFNQESLSTPAFAISGRAEFPTGRDSEGVDTELKLILTKTLGKGSALDRIHLNASWLHNARSLSDERSDLYRVILGYSRRLGPDTILVADFVRQQEMKKGDNSNVLELGIRRQLNPLTTLSVGAGAGIAEQSPDFRFTLGFQRSF